jgi:hypothetical protein
MEPFSLSLFPELFFFHPSYTAVKEQRTARVERRKEGSCICIYIRKDKESWIVATLNFAPLHHNTKADGERHKRRFFFS